MILFKKGLICLKTKSKKFYYLYSLLIKLKEIFEIPELSFFIEQDNGQYERYDELHRERTYPLEQYLDALKKVGFTKIEVSADFDQKITGENIRWFFKAEK